MLKIIIILITLISCVEQIPVNTTRDIDLELIEFVSFAEYELDVHIDYPIVFGEIEENVGQQVLGQCRSRGGEPIHIYINEDRWDRLSYNQKQILILHEIGHCSFDLDHEHSNIIDLGETFTCPQFIMQEHAFNWNIADTCYENNMDFYIDQIRNI